MEVFRGIRYARAQRLERPVLEKRLSSFQDLDLSPIICPQNYSKLDDVLGGFQKDEIQGEDCLRLSVYTPDTKASLPVVVWIHGGAYVSGSGLYDKYNAEDISRKGNIVVVSINYRIGAFGFLCSGNVRNLGLEDQVCALRWVKENIHLFGGNPDKVTVMGQSAGAYSILNHIAALKECLFQRAILFSAPFLEGNPRKVQSVTKEFKKALGKDIKSASVEEILSAQKKIERRHIGMPFCSVNTGILKPGSIAPGLRDVLLFCQKHDARPFFPVRAVSSILTSLLFRDPMFRYERFLSANGVHTGSHVLVWREKTRTGAVHCSELPLLFGSWDSWKDASFLSGVTEEEFEKESETLKGQIIDFVNN